MRIIVKYSAQLRQMAGTACEELELSTNCELAGALERLVEQRTALRPFLFDSTGGLRPSLLLCLGAEQVQPARCRPLKDGDELSLLSPIAGG